jgi:hypothetical protein
MAFAFARVYAAGTDDTEGFSALDEAHHEQSTFRRITDDHLAVFADGMIRVVFDTSDIVIEHGLRLGERYSVLAEVGSFLIRTPVECRHNKESRRGGSIVRFAVAVNSGMPVGDMLSKDISLLSGT